MAIEVASAEHIQMLAPESGEPLTDEEYNFLWPHLMENPEAFAVICGKIAPKEKARTGVIQFLFKPLQKRTNEIAEQMRFLGVQERFINAKARQVMLTTYWVFRAWWYHMRASGPRQTDLMGDIWDTTETMKTMFDTFYGEMPWDFRHRRPIYTETTQKLRDTKARVRLHTALTPRKRPVQGSTSSTIIATEVPYYSHGEKLLLSMLNALPDLPETLAVLEGTANGATGAFYDRWLQAIDHAKSLCRDFGAVDQEDLLFNRTGWGYKPDKYGRTHPHGYWDGSWYPLFWSCFDNPEYVRDPELENINDNTLTDDEHQMIETYGTSYEQIAWYRATLRDKCGGDEKLMCQEYPRNWKEAFIMSGRTVFDAKTVSLHISRSEILGRSYKEMRQPGGKIRRIPYIQRVDLDWLEDDTNLPNNPNAPIFDSYGYCTNKHHLRVEATTDRFGQYLFRRLPRSGWDNLRYCIGADVAEGLEQGDYSAALVMDRKDLRFDMMMQERVDEEEFAHMLAKMGVYYNYAWILVEQNKQGDAVINELKRIYPNVMIGSRFEKGQQVPGLRYGWLTTDASKPQMVTKLKAYLRDYADGMEFYEPWHELQTFTKDEHGRMGAEGKRLDPGTQAYDDLAMAWMITLMAHSILDPPTELSVIRDDVDKQEQRTGTVKLLHDVDFS